MSRHDVGRQETISRLLEMCLIIPLFLFTLLYFIDFRLYSVSSLLAGAGIAGVAIGMGACVFCLMSSMAFHPF